MICNGARPRGRLGEQGLGSESKVFKRQERDRQESNLQPRAS